MTRCRSIACLALFSLATCKDISRFSVPDGRYEGVIVDAGFVRAGLAEQTRMCMTFDAGRIQQGPGSITTSDGSFAQAQLRSIPQVWHDSLSAMTFGDGRIETLMYAVEPTNLVSQQDAIAFVSLMQSGEVEVRLLRGAPARSDAPRAQGAASAMFAIFRLKREQGPCSF
jgi:hypothetical protein